MKKLFWIGPRESDIAYTGDLFEGSVTYYGSNEGKNHSFCKNNSVRIDHNAYSEKASRFILDWQMEQIRRDPECRFMSYNPNCVIGAPEEIIAHSLCLNDEKLMARLNDKLEFRKIADGIVPLLKTEQIKGEFCKWEKLRQIPSFEKYDAYVIQKMVASGGYGTYLMTSENVSSVFGELEKEEEYLVSGYLTDNISVNLHTIISDYDIIFFPASVQVIQEGNHRLLYRGADFVTFAELSEDLKEKLRELSGRLAQKIQSLGYRGVMGMDAIISGQEICFLEINNRFQGSSILLNRALSDNGLPSLQKLNYDAFYEPMHLAELKNKAEQLRVPYSLYTCVNEAEGIHSRHMFRAAAGEKTVVSVEQDGYDPFQEAEPYANQFSLIFQTNILSVCNQDRSVRLHPNVGVCSAEWRKRILALDWSAVKTAVINRGAVLSRKASEYIAVHGKMRIGTYCSLDLYVNGIYINCPLYVKLTGLSPFEIDINEQKDGLCLKFYGQPLFAADYDRKQSFAPDPRLHENVIEQICFLATDRLRLQNNAYCTFPEHGLACRFCEAEGIRNHFGEHEILEAIDLVFRSGDLPFRHILIGGLSNDIGKERPVILHMCERIRKYTAMPVYLMCLPPDPEAVKEYYHAGVNEFAFNLEIYDRGLAKKYMPGKGCIPLKRYLDAFDAAVSLAGKNGAVRCAFIVGLEPMDSLLEGIELICRRGVAPILSVFRPIPGTELGEMIPPSDEWLYEVMEKSERICRRYGLTLGPQCPACRNNTLTFAAPGETESLYQLGWKRK